jgi:adenosylcobalamin-dependent ribonucleoside-triphosphate reductase
LANIEINTEKYKDFPKHMNELGKFVYYRTYSRFIPELKRRETWKETAKRAATYNVNLARKHYEKLGYVVPENELQEELQLLFDNMFNLKQSLSGRTLWVGGAETGVAETHPLANFNCAFMNMENWLDFYDLTLLLMLGTGIGVKATFKEVAKLAPIRNKFTLVNLPYEPLPKEEREENSTFTVEGNTVTIEVGDSKEGWSEAVRLFFKILTDPAHATHQTIRFNYNSVRPKGERLIKFGGTASGPEVLFELFEGIEKVLKGTMDPAIAPWEVVDKTHGFVKVRPVAILDIANLIGSVIVVGGVRRTAEIFLLDENDFESMFAKYGINGIWNEEGHKEVIQKLMLLGKHELANWVSSLNVFDANARPLHHRRMSNNSIALENKPSRAMLNLIFTMMKETGEPGFINMEEGRKRRPNFEGMNPCAEILLDSKNCCNLTTVNLVAFVKNGRLQRKALEKAQRLSARAGLRMTLVDLELSEWDRIQKRDRLLGTSLTGVKDAIALLGYTKEQEDKLLAWLGDIARDEANKYAQTLRVPSPLLVTTIKPEGTISQLFGGVSSGLHYSHSPYYIRRIRINAHDPLAKVAMSLGWQVNPEVGQDWLNARTLVIDFPVYSGANKTKDDVYVDEQFDTYFAFQKHYTEHNSSNTIHVRPNEWAVAENIIWDKWNEFMAVSFLSYDGGTYELAPYEAISKEKYDELKSSMKIFDPSLLQRFETGDDFDLGDEGCIDGACGVR